MILIMIAADDPTQMGRLGVQATFKPCGTVTADDIYAEVNFASMAFDTFFALTYINTLHNELQGTDQYNTSKYVPLDDYFFC